MGGGAPNNAAGGTAGAPVPTQITTLRHAQHWPGRAPPPTHTHTHTYMKVSGFGVARPGVAVVVVVVFVNRVPQTNFFEAQHAHAAHDTPSSQNLCGRKQ
jgi:hypothetical protein